MQFRSLLSKATLFIAGFSLQSLNATPIPVETRLGVNSWNLPGGEQGTLVDAGKAWVQSIEVPELSAKDAAVPGKWRGVISLDAYGSPEGGQAGLVVEAIDPASGEAFAKATITVEGRKTPRAKWAAIVSSEHRNDLGERVFDGDPKTDWHSRYGNDKAKAPHWIGLIFGEPTEIEGVRYLPRQGGFTNGVAKDYRVEVREKGGDWQVVSKGRSPKGVADDREALVVTFDQKRVVEGVRFVIETDWSGGGFGTAAELSVLGYDLPEKGEAVQPSSRAWLEVPPEIMKALVGKTMGVRVKAVDEQAVVIGKVRLCRVHNAPTQKLFGRSNGGLGPDKMGAGLLGFDAMVEHKQTAFTIMNVREESAAAQAGLVKGDVVVSINGNPLSVNDLNPGWTWFERSHEALLGRASEELLSQKKSKLRLGVLRNGKVEELELILRRQGGFTSMNPADDVEAAAMLKDLIGYLEKNQREDGSWGGHVIKTTFASLALLATKESGHEDAVLKAIDWTMKKYPEPEKYGNLGFWFGGYAGTLYSEWYLQTGDKRVLPYLDALKEWAIAGQHQSKWNVPALGHGPDGLPYGQKSLVAPSCHLLVFEALAKRCGMESEIWELLLPYMTLAWSDPEKGGHGSLGYNQSYKDKAEFWFRSGTFAMACQLRGEKKEMETAMIDFMHRRHPWIRNSHAYGEPGGAWGLLALNLCAPEKFAEVMKEYSWWFSLAWEPGYGLRFTTPHMGAPYMGEDDLMTAAYALVLQASKRNLHLTGQPAKN
ncbi:MAG: DUF6288 domain-containing protein [Akkermansiaceae bacterium]